MCFPGHLLFGQNIPFRLYTPHDGLPQSQVVSMFQDTRGYIWVGTHNGLAYFDGLNFHVLSVKDGLPNGYISVIQEDKRGNIVFCAGRWLCKYDGKKITYDTISLRIKRGVVFQNSANVLWAIGAKDDLLYYSLDWKNWKLASDRYDVLKNKTWRFIAFDEANDRFIMAGLNQTGMFVFKDNDLHKIHDYYLDVQDYLAPISGYAYRMDSIFTIQEISCAFFGKGTGDRITHVIKNGNKGLFFINANAKYLWQIDNFGRLDSIYLGVNTNFLFLDKAENLWVATEQGLIRVFIKGFINFGRDKLDGVWSMVEDIKGNMWFGEYYTKKLKLYNNNTFEHVKINYSIDKDKLKGELCDFYFGGGRDQLGNLYFPTSYGIKKYDGFKFSFLDKPLPGKELSFNLYLDTVERIIISGTYGGANIIDLKTGKTRFFGKQKGLLNAGNILSVTKDGQRVYWLGGSLGLACLDLSRDTIFKNYASDLKNFPYFGTTCVFGDFLGNIWIGSAQGLLWHDVQKDTFILVAPNIIQTSVNCLAVYKDMYLVIGANDGIYFLDLKAFYGENKIIVRYFNHHNGYMGIEPNQNCMYVDSKDNIWVSASDIVTKITPSELDMASHPLALYIIEINNERVLYENYGKSVDLPNGINTVKIRFEGVGLERPRNTEFSYKTNNGNWSEWRTEDFAILDNLSSGTYAFYVRTRPAGTVNGDEVKQASIQIKVNAPLLKEWWFPWAAAFAFFAVVVLAWVFIRSIQQKAAKQVQEHQAYIKEQEERDRERTRQIKYLQIQTLQAQLNPHFIFNVLQAIQTRIYEGSREVASSLIVDLGHLIRRFLESSVNMDLKRGRNSEITVKEEINLLKSYIEFEQLQYSNKFDYGIHVDGSLDIENVYVPPMLIQPYVENAIKHGILYEKERRCRVDVSFVKTDDDRLLITIVDNGVGRTRAKEIQGQFIQMYKSRGTQILDERIKIMKELGHGIHDSINDNPSGGTIVTLEIDM